MSSSDVTICAVGDVAAFFKNPESMFPEHTAAVLNAADITFGQNERHYTDVYTERDLVPGVPLTEIAPRSHAAALKKGGFDVISFASNHSMDLGGKAMLETIDVLKGHGFEVIGVGKNSAEARKPAILERKGTRVGFIGYCSVGRTGFDAGPDRPGCAPMRASTFYQQLDYQPGNPPLIVTLPFPEDVESMRQDIRKVRGEVDVLVLSFHWGIHHIPEVIAMYEKEVAHAAIDEGVDLIIGHHAHMVKGIERYRGKGIFYCMGNFALDMPLSVRKSRASVLHKHHAFSHVDRDSEYDEFYSFSAECRRSMIVKCRISAKKIDRLSFLPVMINPKAQPVIVTDHAGVQDALAYIRKVSASQGFDTKFAVEDGEIVVLE